MTDKAVLAFGEQLRRLREQAGFRTGKQFADELGWIASKVSRIENGRTLPSDSDVLAWLDAAKTAEDTTAALRDELRDLRLARSNWKHRLRTGHAPRQQYHQGIERTAQRISMVEFFLVPGLVQTSEYARAVFEMAAEMHRTPHDTDEAVRQRIRRQEVLYEPDKDIHVLIAESVLAYPIAPRPVMLAQIDRLISLSSLPNVHLGVIPSGTVLPTITLHGYLRIDDLILVEVNHTEFEVTDPDDVALYGRITDSLWSVAHQGDHARSLLKGTAAHLV